MMILGRKPYLIAMSLALLGIMMIRPVDAAPLDVIICGSGGTDEYREQFADWGLRLRKVLIDKLSHSESRVYLLLESPGEGSAAYGATRLDAIEKLFDAISPQVHETDDVYIFLIGHGDYVREETTLNIPGPDLTAKRLGAALQNVPARRIAIINAASSSAGFINEISAQRRIIATATKSVTERNATHFIEGFIAGLEEQTADRNHDERISVLEACEEAARRTSAWYKSESLIASEHSLLDDNGDGLGTRLPIEAETDDKLALDGPIDEDASDGAFASVCYLQDFMFPPNVPADLIERYLATLDSVEQLKRAKREADSADYHVKLEKLLLDAARANREIRRLVQQSSATAKP